MEREVQGCSLGKSIFKGQGDDDDKPEGEAGENKVMETQGRQLEQGRPD